MELSDETTAKTDGFNCSNVVRGLATDIKITFKNKKTIIAPIQQPAPESIGNALAEVESDQAESSTAVPMASIIKPLPKRQQQSKISKIKTLQSLIPMNNFGQTQTPKNINYNIRYKAGIPRSFLEKEHQLNALAQQTQATAQNIPEVIPVLNRLTSPMPILLRKTDSDPKENSYVEHLEVPDWINTVADDESVEGKVAAAPAASNAPAYQSSERAASAQTNPMNEFNLDLDEDFNSSKQRLDAFYIAGPPKKPKLAINLLFDNTNVDKKPEPAAQQWLPVPQRAEVANSRDEVVARYRNLWPWSDVISARRVVSGLDKINNLPEFERLIDELTEKVKVFIKVSILRVPEHIKGQDLLDIILERVKEKVFVPCFIEQTESEVRFLVAGQRGALVSLYKSGLSVRHAGHAAAMPLELGIAHFRTVETSFASKVLRKRLLQCYDGEMRLDLRAFCVEPDIINFIYFPLKRVANQIQLRQLNAVEWNYLVELNLSDNNLKSIEGFELAARAPRLSILNLSNNQIPKVSILLSCRGLNLDSLRLDGNPLCLDYNMDPARYLKAVRLIFPKLKELDGVELVKPGELPSPVRNFCPEPAKPIVEKYLETLFPLLDAPAVDRAAIIDLYHDDCTLTITHYFRFSTKYRYLRSLFTKSRALELRNFDAVRGAAAVEQLVARWPLLAHDPATFVVDVLHHCDSSTIIRVSGAVKTTAASLAEDEQLLAFSRTAVLTTEDGLEYKICNEMIHWEQPSRELEARAFAVTSNKYGGINTKFESNPDDELKEKLITLFVATTGIDVYQSYICLEKKKWDIRAALKHFMKLVESDDLQSLQVGMKKDS